MWKSLVRRTLLEWVSKPQTRETGKRQNPTKSFIPCIQVESHKSVLFGSSNQQNSDEKEERKRGTCHEHSSRHFRLYADSFLETFGWVGTAFILGLHLRNFCWKSHLPSTGKHHEHVSGTIQPNHQMCRHLCNLISPFITSPLVFNMHSSKQRLQNNLMKSPDTVQNQETLKEHTNDSNNDKEQENSEDISKVCQDMVGVTMEYFGEMENFVGVTEKNKQKAFIHFRKGAKYGCAKAHFNLGICYETGYGTVIDLKKAVEHYKLASQAGHSLATYNLGVYYLEGKGGLSSDENTGLELITKAAKQGVHQAKTHMGIHFLEQQDWLKGLPYLQEASNEDPEAKYYLAMCYENGWGVSRNVQRAVELYQKAASAGSADALLMLQQLKQEDKTIHEDKCSKHTAGVRSYSSVPELCTPKEEKTSFGEKLKDLSLYLDIVFPDAWKKPSKANFWIGDPEENEILSSETHFQNQVTLPKVDIVATAV